MKAHRLASYFPLLEGEEYEQLKQDIADNGQLEPIVTYQGEILDGANRYRACMALGIEPRYREYEGDDPLSYVISANIRRRHLNESQMAMIATEMLPEIEADARKRMGHKGSSLDEGLILNQQGFASSSLQAAKKFGISAPTVQRAKRIKEQAPERVPDIVAGDTSVYMVDAELRAARAAEQAAKKEEKRETRERQENPLEVKEYLDALKAYKQALEKAIRVAEYGKFSPEAMQFAIRKHDNIRDLLDQFEGVRDERGE